MDHGASCAFKCENMHCARRSGGFDYAASGRISGMGGEAASEEAVPVDKEEIKNVKKC